VRRLPPERVSQLVDFARFLEFQTTERYDDWLDEQETEIKEDMRAGEEKWDKLLAKPEAKRVMREMAREAGEDYRAGRTTELVGATVSSMGQHEVNLMVNANIAIPRPIFEVSEQLAQQFGMSRSELYSAALTAYAQVHQKQAVTELLNRVYEAEPSAMEPALVQIQVASIGGGPW